MATAQAWPACAHLKARALAGKHRNWLMFGERHAKADTLCADEVAAWQRHGVLERCDRVFSRDDRPLRYVQDLLLQEAETLRRWVAAGAAVYVSGSLHGMTAGVDAALRHVLGDALVIQLTEQGRYRRDVY